MKKQSTNRLGLIVIDNKAVGKHMCVAYHREVRGVDFLEAVEEFFEEMGIEVEPETVEKIAAAVYHKGFATWDSFHLEMLIK